DIAAKARYTGYLDQRARLRFASRDGKDPVAALGLSAGRLALCLVGGGQDGAELATAFADADLPPNTNGVLVTGPCMPADVQGRLALGAAREPRRRVVPLLPEPTRLLRRADHVVAMGGYNTVCEVLSFAKPALIVPRVRPRCEQLIRAERLRALGLVDVLHPRDLSPAALSAWLARGRTEVRRPREHIDVNGLRRSPRRWAALEDAAATVPGMWGELEAARGEDALSVCQAAVLACEVRRRAIDHLHAHFASAPATVSRLASRLAKVPYTFTAHAKDIFHESVRPEDLRRKLADAAAVVTVSGYNWDYLRRA